MDPEKRKKVENLVIDTMIMMEPETRTNAERYKTMFASMSDKEFDIFMKKIRDKKEKFIIYIPNLKIVLKIQDLLDTCKSLGIKLFERIRIWDTVGKRYFLTPHEYLVIKLPVRRSKQFLMDKISIPESDTTISMLTGQVRKPDKGSSMSTVEMKALESKGLNKTVQELMNIRGGNIEAYADFKSSLEETGQVSMSEIDPTTSVRSKETLRSYLFSMHIDNNF